MIYLQLFISFFKVGLFSIGGGYAALPLIQTQVVTMHHWLNLSEFTNVITISQMTPGPIALNAATFVGIRIAGIQGAIFATAGCITPSLIIVLTLAFFYYKYRSLSAMQTVLSCLRPAVVALIAAAALTIMHGAFLTSSGWDFIAIGLFLGALVVLRVLKWNPVLVMILTGAIGCVLYLFPSH